MTSRFSSLLRAFRGLSTTPAAGLSGVLAVPVLLLLLSGCFLIPEEEDILPPPLIEPPAVRYNIAPIRLGTIEQVVSVSGSFESARQHDMFFRSSGGRIKSIHVQVGETVEPGNLLVELYGDDIERSLALRRLDLVSAELSLGEAKARRQKDYTADTLRIDLSLEALALDAATKAYELEKKLSSRVETTAFKLETLKRDLDRQKLLHDKARIRLEEYRARAAGDRTVEAAELEIRKIRIEIDHFSRQLEETRLTAPVQGVITYVASRLTEGETVQAYQTILRIADPGNLRLLYRGQDADKFALGNTVDVELDGARMEGTVIQTAINVPWEERESYRDTVLFSVNDLPATVKIGDYARIRLVQARRENVIVIPKGSLYRYASRRYVQIITDGLKQERDVETGIETATEIEIRAGLREGEQLVVN